MKFGPHRCPACGYRRYIHPGDNEPRVCTASKHKAPVDLEPTQAAFTVVGKDTSEKVRRLACARMGNAQALILAKDWCSGHA